jgi:transposase
MDEAGFDGDPRPRRGWYKVGKRKKIYRTQKHIRMNVSGMCCPETGEFFALEFPYSNRESFQCFISAANKEIASDDAKAKEYIILDNASWHKSTSVDWGRFTPLFLPPYSPDMNPIERIWAYLKQTYFSDFCALNLDELIQQLDLALCSIWNDPTTVNSITNHLET